MKDLVRLPSAFLLAFLLLFLATLGISLLAAWGTLLPAQAALRAEALAPALARLPRLAQQALPISVLAALLAVLMRIAKKPGSRLLSLLLPPAGAFVLLVFGWQALGSLAALWPRGDASGASGTLLSGYLEPGVFNPVSAGALYVESLETGRASGIVVLEEQAQRAPRLSYVPRAVLQVRGDTAALRLGERVVQWRAQRVYEALFAGDPVLRPFLADLRAIDAELSRQYAEARGTFYLSCLALVVALCGVAVLLRLTEWPLLNVSLTLLASRGLLALFVLLRPDGASALGKSLGRSLGGARVLQSLPAAVLLLLGVLLLLVDLLFVPFGREGEGLNRA